MLKSNGRIKTTNISDDKNVIEQVCDNGHELYVTRRTKQLDTNCFHCADKIAYKEQMITCTGSCKVSMCLKCSGCCNAHVVHRKIVNEPLPAKNNSCLRCMTSLSKQEAVNWCFECSQAFCPEQCNQQTPTPMQVDWTGRPSTRRV